MSARRHYFCGSDVARNLGAKWLEKPPCVARAFDLQVNAPRAAPDAIYEARPPNISITSGVKAIPSGSSIGLRVSTSYGPRRRNDQLNATANEKIYIMQGYKEPSFQERMAVAQSAKNKALKQLKSRAPIDPAERARRLANQAAKDEAQRIKRAAAQAAKRAAQAAREDEQHAKCEQERLAAAPRVVDEAELKAARDARYAARKARKMGRS